MKDIYLRHGPNVHFDHKELLLFLSKWIQPQNYLELGTLDGSVFKEVAKNCVKATTVDIKPREFELPSNAQYYMGTTDDFFRQLPPTTKYDMIFVDADHTHTQSLKDFINAQSFLIDDGIILLHDTYPINTEYLSPNLCYDSYKTALYIKNHMADDFEQVTLPFPPGATIIRKIKRSKQLLWL